VGRAQAAALVGAGLGLLLLGTVDRTAREGHVVADGRWDRGFFRGYSPWEAGAGRVASPDSELVVGGLWSGAPLAVTVTAASALPQAQVVSVYANGAQAVARDLGGRFGTLRFAARADGEGTLRLRFVGDGRPASAIRVARVDVAREGDGGVPPRRWLLYLGLLLALCAVARCAGASPSASLGLPLAAAIAVAWALRAERLGVLEHLPLLLTALILALAAFGVSRLLSMPGSAAAWVAASFGLRALLGLHPAFPGVDLSFHAHNVLKLLAGQPVASRVASPAGDGMLGIPYPPLLYVLVSPFVSSEASAETALRVAIVLLEGSAPWLVLAILRAAGAPARAAAAAAVTLAVMPEGLLVLAKGIAANVLGAWLGLVVAWGLVAGVSAPLLALLMAGAFLAHPGAAATLAGLVLLYALAEARWGRFPKSRAASLLGAGLAAGAFAWLAYYREVAAVTMDTLSTLGSHLRDAPRAFFAFRGIHVLKIAQNLVLKMGGGPLVLALVGLKRGEAGRAGSLLRAWLVASAALAVLAVMTPLAFRFEYFLAPAVAMAAGLGAERWAGEGKGRFVTLLWALAFVVQVTVGLALLLGRFELISVILPSPRWAWPLRLW
jgi:hypothetical protein